MTDPLPDITEIERLTIRPGDRLVVHVGQQITRDDIGDIKAQVRAALDIGEDVPVLVLGPGMTLRVAECRQEPTP